MVNRERWHFSFPDKWRLTFDHWRGRGDTRLEKKQEAWLMSENLVIPMN
jgi:hypothetical protein